MYMYVIDNKLYSIIFYSILFYSILFYSIVQCIKKTPSMISILHLKTAFNARIERVVIGYMEVRVIFDRYVEVSLKENTRKKRVTYVAAATAGHVVHDGMSINTSLKQL